MCSSIGRALAESLLISLLRHSPLDAALEAARHMIYGHSLPSPGCLLMHQRLVYAPGESGGLCVVTGVGHTWSVLLFLSAILLLTLTLFKYLLAVLEQWYFFTALGSSIQVMVYPKSCPPAFISPLIS